MIYLFISFAAMLIATEFTSWLMGYRPPIIVWVLAMGLGSAFLALSLEKVFG